MVVTTVAVHAHPSVFILVSMQEAWPDDPKQPGFQQIKGVKRQKVHVQFGVPLSYDTFAFDVSQLRFIGSNDVQFRVLRRWPTRRIQWLQIDALVDLDANQLRNDFFLTSGTYVPGTPLAVDLGGQISINTGAAQFTIKKKGFNLFDKVVVGGKELVSTGSTSGIELTAQDGTVYSSALDPNASVTIEQNGSVHAVVRVRGKHVAKNGSDLLDFTLRMHFIKTKSHVKLEYILKNGSKRRLENVSFKHVSFVLRSTLGKPAYRFNTHKGEVSGTLSTGTEAVRLFQGRTDFPLVRDTGFTDAHAQTGKKGYTLLEGTKTLASGGEKDRISLFYAQASSTTQGGPGIMIGTRFAEAFAPQGLGIDGDGTLRIGVFPEGNDKLYAIRFGSHITREHVIHFEAAASAPRDHFFRFQYPVIGRSKEPDWFNQEDMLFLRVVAFAEEANYSKDKGWPVDDKPTSTNKRFPTFVVPEFLNWSSAGMQRQLSFGLVSTFNAIRQQNKQAGAYYLLAEQWLTYNADQSVFRSDDFDARLAKREAPGLVDAKGLIKSALVLPNAQLIPSVSPLWTSRNHHAYSLAYWYFLTGKERFSFAMFDWGEYLLQRPEDGSDSRSFGWSIYNLVEMFRFTNQTEYQQKAWSYLKSYALDRDSSVSSTGGTDWKRGAYVGTKQITGGKRTVNALTQGHILASAYGLFEKYGGADELQTERARDLLLAVTQFVGQELWVANGDTPGDFGFAPTYTMDAKPLDPTSGASWNGGVQAVYESLYFGYLMTTNRDFLTKGEKLLRATAYNPGNSDWFQDLLGRQMAQHLLENIPLFPTWKSMPIKAVKLADGRFQLTWIAPYGARAYWIKYADKPIVSSLQFDASTQSFSRDPAQHTPFFAAVNVPGEPEPVDPGVYQEWTIKGLPQDKPLYFSARYFTTDPRPPITESTEERVVVNEPVPEVMDGGINDRMVSPDVSDGGDKERQNQTDSPGEPPVDAVKQPDNPGESVQGDGLDTPEMPQVGCQCGGCDQSGGDIGFWWGLVLLFLLALRRSVPRKVNKGGV
jgi:hypothetical protein